AQLATEELNQQGGLLGRKIVTIDVDCKSDWDIYGREAERLITQEKVCTIFGCWTSASRKSVKSVVEKHDHLLVYPMAYEGLEQSPNIFYIGTTPNQQVQTGLNWAMKNLGTRRFFLIGSDYLWPRASSAIVEDELRQMGGSL